MEVLNGLFRSNCEFITNDNYGGNVFKIYSYSYLLFINNGVYMFTINGHSIDFEVKNVLEKIINNDVTLLNGLYSLDEKCNIVCDFEFKPYMAGELKLIGKVITDGKELQFDAFSNNETFWSNKFFSIQNILLEIKYLRDRGIKNVTLKDGTNLNLDDIDLSNLNWAGWQY